MLNNIPITNESYKFKGVPLTRDEQRRFDAKRVLSGTFRFRGFGRKNKAVLIFREPATTQDGVIYTGRTITLSTEDFNVGQAVGKIAGRTKRARKSK